MTLIIDKVAFERNQQILFTDVNEILESGDCLQIKGANGSGKSTLLRILAGLIEPQTGQVLWQQQSIFDNRDTYQQQLNYLGHQNGHRTNLTVLENLELSLALANQKKDKSSIKDAIKKVGLGKFENTFIHKLSAGQSRRVGLARLVLNPTPLWILDEPTTALDIEGHHILTTILNQYLENNGICIIATHQHLTLTGKEKILTLENKHA